MKKIINFLLIIGILIVTTQAFSQDLKLTPINKSSKIYNLKKDIIKNETKDEKVIKKEITSFLNSIKNNDVNKFYSFLPNKNMINGVCDEAGLERSRMNRKLGYHLTVNKNEYLNGVRSATNWYKVKTSFIFKEKINNYGENIENWKLTVFFSIDNSCYDIELYLTNYNNKNYYRIKELHTKNAKKISCNDILGLYSNNSELDKSKMRLIIY